MSEEQIKESESTATIDTGHSKIEAVCYDMVTRQFMAGLKEMINEDERL